MKWLLLLAVLGAGLAQANVNGLDTAQERQYHQLINELRCLVCQNQTIAESNAPLAVDLREQVRVQLTQGRSKAEITRYLTDRYGDFVLYRPPFKTSTLLLWAGPFLLLLAGLVAALRFLRARPAATPPRVVSEAEVQQLLDETRAALKAQDETRS